MDNDGAIGAESMSLTAMHGLRLSPAIDKRCLLAGTGSCSTDLRNQCAARTTKSLRHCYVECAIIPRSVAHGTYNRFAYLDMYIENKKETLRDPRNCPGLSRPKAEHEPHRVAYA